MFFLKELLIKFNIDENLIPENILELKFDEDLSLFTEYDFNKDILEFKGDKVNLSINFNEEWDYLKYIFQVFEDYPSLRIYNNKGVLHLIN